jgi:rod shape-determining protein MreC
VVAVVVSIVMMALDHRQHHLDVVRSALAVITSPLQRIAQLPVTLVDWASETFATRDRLQEDNGQLRETNLLLMARLQKLEALEAENLQLRNLLDSSIKVGERVLIGELIAVDLDPYTQQVTINKGSTSGVYEGQPVLDADAVMGQVVHATPFTARVLLVTDTAHAIPVQVQRNGLRTIAVGTGRTNQLELPYLPINADIREGDLLVTSGLGGTFPPGYPVAVVSTVSRRAGEAFPHVLATPRAHLDRVREVLLVWTMSPLQVLQAQEQARSDEPAGEAAAQPAEAGADAAPQTAAAAPAGGEAPATGKPRPAQGSEAAAAKTRPATKPQAGANPAASRKPAPAAGERR